LCYLLIEISYASGALSLESACRVSYYRGFLAGELRKELSSNPGAMISVNLAEDEVQGCLKKLEYDDIKSIQVACINSPSNCTLSGGAEAIDVLKEYLDDEGIFAQKLKTGIAYHSSSMQAIAEKYASHIGSPKSGTRPMLPMISSVTGQLISPNELRNAQYWVNNLVNPVRFSQAIRSLVQNPEIKEITDIAEVGSHATLKRPIQDTLKQIDESKGDIYYSSVLLRTKPPVRAALEFIGGLFSRGYDVLIPMANQQANDQSFVVNGPEYPFDHSNVYWAESRLSSDFRLRADVPGALGMRVSDWNPLEPRWRRLLSLDTCPWVGDHVVCI
jgi:acyl transferase domain-containing protein